MVHWVVVAASCIYGGFMTRAEIVCIFGPTLLLIGGLVGFSCYRDAAALRAAPLPLVAPLHP